MKCFMRFLALLLPLIAIPVFTSLPIAGLWIAGEPIPLERSPELLRLVKYTFFAGVSAGFISVIISVGIFVNTEDL